MSAPCLIVVFRYTQYRGDSESWKWGISVDEMGIEYGLAIVNTTDYTRVFNSKESSPDITMVRNINGQVKWHVDRSTNLCSDHKATAIDIPEEVK